jgi:BirA family biotin operon repressor/biotin-[acetyl-CoA-carboxylase] ligase
VPWNKEPFAGGERLFAFVPFSQRSLWGVGMAIDLETFQRALTGRLGHDVHQFEQVTSTMDLARSRAAGGAPEGLVVLAEEQTAGRGRMGRPWVSPPGLNLYFTLVLRPRMDALRRLPYVVPLGVSWGLETLGLSPKIKWPNDIWFGGKKAAGVLIDTVVEGPDVVAVLVGVGMNVNLRPAEYDEIRDIATSLADAAGRELPREPVMAAVLDGIASALDAAPAVAFAAWKARLSTLGQHVTMRAGSEVIEGRAADVDDTGSLVIEFPDGTHRTYSAGEVTSQV